MWEKVEPAKRWLFMSYTIAGGRFVTAFSFPEERNPDEIHVDRRPRVVKAKFGDKPLDFSDP
jgi:hypothetical protein